MNTYHRPITPKPKPAPLPKKGKKPIKASGKTRKQKTNRQKLVSQISNLCRKITKWRDGCICVLSEVDGSRCNEVSQWGHVVAQGASGFLKHSLSNSFRQCGSHNTIHNHNSLIYNNWYRHKFGNRAIDMLEKASYITYYKFTIPELWEMRDNLQSLYEKRFEMNGATLEKLIEAGYYGEIIQEAWRKDGRI